MCLLSMCLLSLFFVLTVLPAPLPIHIAHLNRTLLSALAHDDAPEAMECLDQGADPNTRADEGQTLLELAARYDTYAVARVLIAHGADVNRASNYGGPLSIAAEGGHIAMIRLLLGHGAKPNGADPGSSPLEVALRECVGAQEPLNQFDYPVSFAVSVYPYTPANRKRATEEERKEIHRFQAQLLEQQHEIVRNKIANGMQIVRLLLAAGADVNYKTIGGWTPLMSTVNPAAVQLLLDHGADVNVRNDRGFTALDAAVPLVVVKMLVEHGADVNAQDINGDTPLSGEVVFNNVDAARYLLTHGADPNLKEKDGRTILQLAKDTKNPVLIALLEQAGAK